MRQFASFALLWAGCGGGVADPCKNVVCNQPLAAVCADTSTLRTYSLTGTCGADGQCSYTATDMTCSGGCADGACVGSSLCSGVQCNNPPAQMCTNANTLRTYAATGTCSPSTGLCSYAPSDTTCPLGCANDNCTVKHVFATGLAYPGNFAAGTSDARATANSICQSEGQAYQNGSTFIAWLGTAAQLDAQTSFTYDGPWYRNDGVKAIDSIGDLLASGAHPLIPLTFDTSGGPLADNGGFWTGTDTNGAHTGVNCSDWSSNSAGDSGTFGDGSTTATWCDAGNVTCDQSKHILCFEQ